MLTGRLLVKTFKKTDTFIGFLKRNKSLINPMRSYPRLHASPYFKVFVDSFKSNIHESNPFINTLFFKVESNYA